MRRSEADAFQPIDGIHRFEQLNEGGFIILDGNAPLARLLHAFHEPRSSRREEALAISDFGFRISDFRQSLLTSAATVQGFKARNFSGKSLPFGWGEGGERGSSATVARHNLAEQRDLLRAAHHKLAALGDDIRNRPAAF